MAAFVVLKSSAFELIKSFISMVQTRFSKKVKVARTDNALELGSSRAGSEFFLTKGILHQTSCAETPQQNGVVERKHRHILEVAMALMFQSKLPLKFWGESVLTTVYIIKRPPSKLL